MPLSRLAAKLQAHTTLLPSQRQLLERVLFQIEFNGFQHLHLVGGIGSGKTTLTLVLAELLSDSMNLAYFDAQPDMTTQQCQRLLLQQWFGMGEYDANLMELLEQPQQQPLVWILDSQSSLPLGCLSLLRAHPIHIITTGPEALADADLNLAIAELTEAEVEQLLPMQMLQTRSAAERLQASAGNLHRLLEPEIVPEPSDSKPVAKLAQKYRSASLALAVLGGIAILMFWWLSQPSEPQPLIADNESRLIVQAWSPDDNAVNAKLDSLGADHQYPDESITGSTTAADEEVLPATDTMTLQTETLEPESLAEVLPATQPEPAAQLETVETEPVPETALPTAEVVQDVDAWAHDEPALLAMNEAHYVLQLGAFSSLNAALTVRQTYPDLAVLIYQRQQNSQLQWVVVLADYPTADLARAMRSEIPERLRAATPFIKTMQQVQQEILSHRPGQGSRNQ